MRSLLFVPGDSERKLEKGFQSGADLVIIDLEDSVAPANKAAARAIAAAFIQALPRAAAPKIYVRVNDLSTGLTDADLAAVIAARPDGIMLPKCNAGADVSQLSAMLRVHEADNDLADGQTKIIALITETAAGVLSAGDIQRSESAPCRRDLGRRGPFGVDRRVGKPRPGRALHRRVPPRPRRDDPRRGDRRCRRDRHGVRQFPRHRRAAAGMPGGGT